MNKLLKEKEFFAYIAISVRQLVTKESKNISIAKQKRENDFATHVDVAVEKLIVEEINNRFPNDAVMAEETFTDAKIPKGRIWIIDPICGTNNLARGIKNFCTNIALVDNSEIVASCVIDYSQGNYYWSIGDGEVYINDACVEKVKRYDVYVEVDFGAVTAVDVAARQKHNRFLKKLVTETEYYLISLNTSLGFAYVGIGKMDGAVNVFNNPWDVCASVFLIQQSGGIVTDLQGDDWQIASKGMIASQTIELHNQLLEAYRSS